MIVIKNSEVSSYFSVEWWVNCLCEPSSAGGIHLGRSWGLVARSTRYKPNGQGGLFEVDDPTMPEDFVDQIEAEVLPFFRSLDTFPKIAAFILKHQHYPVGSWAPWRALLTVALGDIPAAQKIWRSCDTDEHQWQVPNMHRSFGNYDQWCRIEDPLMNGDRAALATLLHEWENKAVTGTKLERYWKSTPFPLEKMS